MKTCKWTRRLLSFLLVLGIVSSFLLVPASAASLSDIKGNWAEEAIQAGVDAGYISGFSDGTFRPKQTVTRGQFAKMLNNAIGLNNTVAIRFSDVTASTWCYEEIRKAVSAQYISGYSDGTFCPDKTITRQEVAVMLSRIVTLPATLKSSTSFKDSSSIGDWARNGVDIIYSKGYMQGDSSNKFNPYAKLTRAQAAQIIYLLRKGETIESSSTAVISSEGLRSNVLYSNNVVIPAESTAASVELKNCRVLGALTVNSGSSVTLTDTTVNYLAAANEDVLISASANTTVKDTVVKNGCTLKETSLTGSGFQNVTLTGSALEASTVKLSGSFDDVDVRSSTVLNQTGGTIAALDVSAKTNTVIQRGYITALTVSAAAAGSTLTLASGVSVGTATMNGSATFFGEGTITQAVENAAGTIYETQPTSITGSAAGQTSGVLIPTIVPAKGASAVAPASAVTLTFPEGIYTADGAAVTPAYLMSSVLQLHQGSISGSQIACSASISGNTVTLTPAAALAYGTTYYLTVNGGTLKNAAGSLNTAFTSYFMTKAAGTEILVPTPSPVNGATGVSADSSITLTFSEALYNASGSALTASYAAGSAVELHKGSASGTAVDFTASVSSDQKTITLVPAARLESGAVYYVVIPASTLKNSSGTANSKFTSSFTTAVSSSLVPDVSPVSGATKVSKSSTITLTFGEAVYQTGGSAVTSSYLKKSVLELHQSTAYGASVAFSASIDSAKKVITITPTATLSSGTTYCVVVNSGTLANSSGTSNSRFVSKFSTGSSIAQDVTFSPENGSEDASVSSSIKISFPDSVYRTGYNTLKTSYLEDTAIELRKGSLTGSKVPFAATISSGNATITITPDSDLDSASTYYVVIADGALSYEDGTPVDAVSSSFATKDTSPVVISVDSDSITGDAAKFTIKTNISDCKMTVTYSASGSTQKTTLASEISTSTGGSKTFKLTNLNNSTTYIINVALSYGDLTYEKSASFTTAAASTAANLKLISLITSAEEYPILTAEAGGGTYTVNAMAASDARISILPAENDISSVSYRIGSSTATTFTTLTASSSGYYSITGLSLTAGQTLPVQIRVTAQNGTSYQTYTVNIVCSY